jgi:hypothetical protein
MKQVVVQLKAASSRGVGDDAFAKARDFGATLLAIHPQSEDATLGRWFTAQVDNAKATELVESLRDLPVWGPSTFPESSVIAYYTLLE